MNLDWLPFASKSADLPAPHCTPGEDLVECLEGIRKTDEERFLHYLGSLPVALRARTTIELPEPFQRDLIRELEATALCAMLESLETDDATDFMQLIHRTDRDKAEAVFELLGDECQRILRQLMAYDEDEAGSLMQIELFSAKAPETIQSSLRRLKKLKAEGHLKDIHHVYVVDEHNKLLTIIPLAELILISSRKHYQEIIEDFQPPLTVLSSAPVEEAVRIIERHDLAFLAVVDRFGHLLGRITHDDVVDLIQEMATEQMYALGRVSAEEELHAGAVETGRSRAIWLAVNLVNVTLVSVVIGFFEDTIRAVVALAVLMPIVANMAGTASIQTLTVVIRQMALGELTVKNALPVLGKELSISVANGALFGLLAMGISYLRFDSWSIAAVMGVAMLVSFVCAGLLGAGVPVLLKRLGVDPAIASSVFVVTAIDVIGFFSFLLLASWFVL